MRGPEGTDAGRPRLRAAGARPAAPAAGAREDPRPHRGYWAESWRLLRADRLAMAMLGVLLTLGVLALAAPLVSASVTHVQPDAQDLDHVFAGVSRGHWLGTDELGRDTLTRLVWGARVSLGVGFLAVAVLILIGGTVGLVAGYHGGLVDDVLMRLVDVLLTVPQIYLLILIATLLPLRIGPLLVEHNGVSLALVLACTGWGGVARLIRAETRSVRVRDFILAARSIGAGDVRILFRHVVPNVLAVIIVAASLTVGGLILTEAALDFIGLGVSPPTPTWGNMLILAQTYLFHSFGLVLLPGAAIVLAVLSANVLGNAVRDALDPRLR